MVRESVDGIVVECGYLLIHELFCKLKEDKQPHKESNACNMTLPIELDECQSDRKLFKMTL